MSYTPPGLIEPVVLAVVYSPPPLSEPVVLCRDAGPVIVRGTLVSDLPAPTLPLAASVAGESLSHDTSGALALELPPPSIALTGAVAGRIEQRGTLSVPLLPPGLPLTLEAQGETVSRDVSGALAASLPLAETLPLTVTISGGQRLNVVPSSLFVTLPLTLPPLSLSGLGNQVRSGVLAADLPSPSLPLTPQIVGGQSDVLRVDLQPPALPLDLAGSGDQVQSGELAADLTGTPIPALAMQATGQSGQDGVVTAELPLTATPDLVPLRVYGIKPYYPPALTSPIRLRIYYLPPPLLRPLILCRAKLPPEGYLETALPAPVFPLVPTVAGVQTDRLWVDLPLIALPDLSIAAHGDYLHAANITAALEPPTITPSLAVAATGEYIHRATAVVQMGPPPTRWMIARLRERPVPVSLAIALPAPNITPMLAVAAQTDQDLVLPDGDGVCAAPNQSLGSAQTAMPAGMPAQQMLKCNRVATTPQQHGVQRFASLLATQTDMIRFRARQRNAEQHGILKPGRATTQHHEAIRYRSRTAQREHMLAIRKVGRGHVRHQEALRMRHNRNRNDEQPAIRTAMRGQVGHHEAIRTRLRLNRPHQEMMWPEPGFWWPPYIPPPLGIRFCCTGQAGYNAVAPPLSEPLVVKPLYGIWPYWYLLYPYCPFIPGPPPGGMVVVPVRRVYRVLNTVILTRVADGAEIPAVRLSLSLGADSWSWSWSCSVPGSARELLVVAGEPQELIATINGESIRLRIDSISRAREFGSSWLSVQGRGRAAILAAPTAPGINRYNTEARTAQQLLIDALTDNGISIGWEIDWGLEDWPVHAGAWSHSGSYIEAATRIAEAGGGYVQGHDTDQTLIIRPYYPKPPWAWADETPDIALPEDVCRTEGIEWVEKAGYNAVWVTGGSGGRRDYIRRTGSDGLSMASTIVDALATDAIMTRQRGIRVLGDTGKQALISVRLPVIAETGIIHPGNLIRYTEQGVTRLGLSRAVAVECGHPEVWQTIKIEARES